jgi:hypothetical protein
MSKGVAGGTIDRPEQDMSHCRRRPGRGGTRIPVNFERIARLDDAPPCTLTYDWLIEPTCSSHDHLFALSFSTVFSTIIEGSVLAANRTSAGDVV